MTKQPEDIINQRLFHFIEDLSLGKTYAFCVRKHLSVIQDLINDGYTILAIQKAISLHRPILYASLRNAISQARRKTTGEQKITPSIDKQENAQYNEDEKKAEPQSVTSSKPVIDNEIKMKWLQLQITSPTLIERLEKYCVSFDDVRSWNLASEFQVSKRLTELIVTKKVKPK